MDNKRNLFFFATKELTQDAFLRWLFENYDDPELEGAAYALLRAMCKLEEDEIIMHLDSTAQWHNIDISVWIQTNKRKIALFIEDKTYSSEHNQLTEYNKHIKKRKEKYGEDIYSVYYKIGNIDKDEEDKIEAAGTNINKWTIFKVDQIVGLLKDFSTSRNMLLRQYVEYVAVVHNALFSLQKPKDNKTKMDLVQWKTYFDKVIIPKLEGKDELFWAWCCKAGQYPYVLLHIEKKCDDKQIPYLEITSRDCVDDHFVASILTYKITDEKLLDRNAAFLKKIEDDGLMSHFRHTKSRKTIGKSPLHEGVKTTEEFIKVTGEYIRYYLELMETWISE